MVGEAARGDGPPCARSDNSRLRSDTTELEAEERTRCAGWVPSLEVIITPRELLVG